MKKGIALFFLLALLALPLFGCAGKGDGVNGEGMQTKGEDFYLRAVVLQTKDRLLVEVIESDYAFGEYIVLTNEGTAWRDSTGAEISPAQLAVGDTVEITYGGQVMMSYPPQIVARVVQILPRTAENS